MGHRLLAITATCWATLAGAQEAPSPPPGPPAPACVPGAQIECACPGGSRGTQVCEEGTHYGRCECAAPEAPRTRRRAPRAAPLTTEEQPEPEQRPARRRSTPPPPMGLGETIAGGALLGLGLALGATSAVFWSDCRVPMFESKACPSPDSKYSDLRDAFGKALGLSIAGGVAIITGVVLLAIGVPRLKAYTRWRSTRGRRAPVPPVEEDRPATEDENTSLLSPPPSYLPASLLGTLSITVGDFRFGALP